MVERLSEDFDFRIVCRDRDLGDLTAYSAISVGTWTTVGRAKVFYATPEMLTLRGIALLMRNTPHDVLYLNSFFDSVFTLRPILARRIGMVLSVPVVIAPRGEFSEGAFNLKRWKKELFTRLASFIGFFDDVVWQVSTPLEATDVRRILGVHESRIHVARNIAVARRHTNDSNFESQSCDVNNDESDVVLRVCFLSRISPKKNLDFALRVLAEVKVPVQFNIYGPQEQSDYWADCLDLINRLPPNVRASYCGGVAHEQVLSVLAPHHLFFVPTLGENFGHVYLEALSAGVPILVSDQTPWRNLLAQEVGWDLPLSKPSEFTRAVESVAKLDASARARIRKNCIEFADRYATDGEALVQNRSLFMKASKSGKYSRFA